MWAFRKQIIQITEKSIKKLRGLSPRANYSDRATAACREINANFCKSRVLRGQRGGFLRQHSRFSRPAAKSILDGTGNGR
jgi:hypothetical protein